MPKQKRPTPSPIFDTLENIAEQKRPAALPRFSGRDFEKALEFLKQYNGSQATFTAYRREIERLLQWSWLIAKKSTMALKREDIETYIKFCQNPPKSWIGLKQVTSRFVTKNGKRVPNPKWRPFTVQLSKVDVKKGFLPDKDNYALSQEAMRAMFAIIGSFYGYLLQENIIKTNPVAQIRQKSKYFRKQQTAPKIPRLTETQWQHVLEEAQKMAKKEPETHERTLFIITALYLMYLRISELVAQKRWVPQMGHFFDDANGNWWFTTVGKGNKQRYIAVSDDMLKALQRYRTKQGLSPLPSLKDNMPLIPKLKGKGAVSDVAGIRRLVQNCFDAASIELRKKRLYREARDLGYATVHWLRHTGISDDINKRGRPLAHVRDDAGHSSSAITDRYNDITLEERHASAKRKRARI
jgi:site-specific recombinase XerD